MMARSLALLGLLIAAPASAREAVVVLRSDDLPAYDAPIDAFSQAVGHPVQVIGLRGDRAVASRVAADLTRDPPPAVLALGAKAAWIAARELPPTVPVVWAMVREPERYDLDGLNLTGVRMEIPAAMTLAQFQLFAPDAVRLGILLSVSNSDPSVGRAIQAAREAGYTVIARRVTSSRDVRRQLATMAREMDAIWLLPDPLVITPDHFHLVRALADRAHVPILAYSETLVEAGAFMCVAPDRAAIGRLAAERVREVMQPGATPASLAPIVPTEARVVLNRDAQQAAGLDIDPALLDFVDEIVRERSDR